MAATFVEINRTEIEDFFGNHGLSWSPDSTGRELCFDHEIAPGFKVRVATSFRLDADTARGKGKDAIRTYAFREGEGGLVKSHVTKRTQNWRRNLADRIDDVVTMARMRVEDIMEREAANGGLEERPALRHEPARQNIHNGTYTIKNRESGGHRTLKISTILPDGEKPPHHFRNQNSGRRMIALMTGPDNEHSFTMVAWLNADGHRMTMRYEGDTGTRATVDLLIDLAENGDESRYAERYELLKEGRCLRCNRKLTTPESIESGIGPICAGRST